MKKAEEATKLTTCVCGATYEFQYTNTPATVDICANCHPFYTGSQKRVETSGRIEKFYKKYGKNLQRNSKIISSDS